MKGNNQDSKVNDLTNQLGDCHKDEASLTTQLNNLKVKLSTAVTALNEEKAKTKTALDKVDASFESIIKKDDDLTACEKERSALTKTNADQA